MGLGQVPGRAAVALVVASDCVQGSGGLVDGGKAEHAFTVDEVRARTRVLYHDRLAARQVAQRPIADPGVLELHARRLGATELAARLLDVRAVRLGAARSVLAPTWASSGPGINAL